MRVLFRGPADYVTGGSGPAGAAITLHTALVSPPSVVRTFHGPGHYIRYASKPDLRLRELAILQIG